MALELDISFDYKKYIKIALDELAKYRIPLTALIILGIFTLTIVHVDATSNPEKNIDRFSEQASDLRKVQIDAEVVDLLNQLEATNIDIGSNFDNNRESPFTE